MTEFNQNSGISNLCKFHKISFFDYAKVWSNTIVNPYFMKISQLENKSGLSRDTIRYYEDIGLLPAPHRSANGYRIYTNDHLAILQFIVQGKAIGFSLKEIKSGLDRYLKLGHLCPEFKQELEAKKHFFCQRIKDDKAVVTHIDKMLKTS